MSLKLRLTLVITLVLAAMLLAGTALLLRAARMDVHAEIQSTANLAMHFLDVELRRAAAAPGTGEVPRFGLAALGTVRHLRVELYDTAGRLLESNHAGTDPPPRVPGWFTRLVGAVGGDAADIRRPVSVGGRTVGELVVRPDPSFEVEEVWDDAARLAQLAVLLFVVTNVLIYWLVGRALAPVDNILRAIGELERGNLATRLPRLELPELARIGREFNRMMDTLQASVTRNRQLSRQLLRVQEEERRSLARELHDELGQGLAAIHADAMALANAAKTGQPAPRESAEAIVEVTRDIMGLVRGMLQRLRPDSLETLGLAESLQELAAAWRQRNRDIDCILSLDDRIGGLGDAIDITTYRIVQEALTNVARHARARRVDVRVRRARSTASDAEILRIEVDDDGAGMDREARTDGFGLAGMRERVEALGGSMSIESQAGQGVKLHIALPLGAQDEAEAP